MSATSPAAPTPATVQPIIVTPDLDRLQAFYRELVGAEEFTRVPEEGPAFFVGLRVGGSELGIVTDQNVETGTPTRILLSIGVQDVDALLDRVGPLGGTVRGQANDMPWGQRVAHIQDPDGNAVNLTQPV
ncbi:VOC family protein [Streptomyces sp. P9-2B-2]|uniref:VOC family protein n=1 Tax=Streptomyces TaxID=1883 RepID=UPI0022597CF9|nr:MULTISPECIES: VOC family protein [Streptomyces]MCX4634969.1 VOC family protein [Streptomyces platensis]WJY41401.1 VOC family protein [Streptomyces sp. P9-2B-2]